MDAWTIAIWGLVSAGGTLLFVKLVADATLLLAIRLKHLERAARRAALQQRQDENEFIETQQAA